MALTDMSAATGSRRQRSDWATGELGDTQTASHATRAAAASADRALRTTALAANSDRLLARLATERDDEDGGYVPQSGPTGAKPTFDPPPTQSAEVAPAVPVAQTLAEAITTDVPDDVRRLTALEEAARHAVEVELDLTGDEPSTAQVPTAEKAHLFDRVPETVMGMRVQPSVIVELSIPEILRELAALRDDGILTDEEFTSKKAELLDRI